MYANSTSFQFFFQENLLEIKCELLQITYCKCLGVEIRV